MCLISPSPNALQTLLNICNEYATSHDIVFNTKKTVCMYIKSKKLKLHNVPNIYLNHNVLEYVTSYKYLGCIITDTLNDHRIY